MRVGVIGPPEADEFAANIVACLPDLGVEAIALGAARRRPHGRRATNLQYAVASAAPPLDLRLQRGVLARALEAELDLVISVEGALHPEVVRALRLNGARVALWFPDHVSNLGVLRMMAAEYSRMYFKDPLLVERLVTTYGLRCSFLPEACNPAWHRPIGEPASAGGIAVVGNMYVTRVHLLNRLASAGIPLTLHGAGWPQITPAGPAASLAVQAPVHREDKSRVFRQAAGVLNNLHPAEMTSVNCRLFEATAAGGAVLCEDRQSLRDLFDVGTEVLAFANYDELVQHIKQLFDEPDLTRRVGDAAAQRALAEHTYQHRLTEILSDLA
ncbi:glycosyltransferase [Blastococcus sp. BMG 814]|uniref:Glycosyltransferase n=1 Tax=Blastococcus carthaginiensis TaxID=3050034 RepID=A0ABT9IE24_9ACTN|nr:glycosyltransferase [Blastococcus carthaginiensis]MDP5183839.1 glycosyltransferase [Blastococcus carthaginiensis]